MALALLWVEDTEGENDALHMRFDIGRNRYYTWQIGDEETINRNGIVRLANVQQRSRVFGPLPESARGLGVLEIPGELITKGSRFAQLLSFRTEDGIGPAISPIVELDWTSVSQAVNRSAMGEELLPCGALGAKPYARESSVFKPKSLGPRLRGGDDEYGKFIWRYGHDDITQCFPFPCTTGRCSAAALA